jgi:hypothetical protein
MLDVTECNVAGVAKEPSNAFAAGSAIVWAARAVVIHVDELPVRKRLVAHAAGVPLRFQKLVELLLGQAVGSKSRLPG